MIIDLPATTSSAINRKMVDLREAGGANTQGRVLTLVIVTEEDDEAGGAGTGAQSTEDSVAAANGASFEHPCRVIVVARGARRGSARMDAQIRVGGDAGASEVVVLRLYGPLADHGAAVVVPLLLADAPVVAWWPHHAPDNPASDQIGALAQRRITDAAAASVPLAELERRISSYRPGDTDLTWTRLTRWRGLLAAALDQPPHPVIREASVTGAPDSVSTVLMAGWLAAQLNCPVHRETAGRAGSGMHSVQLVGSAGPIALTRPAGSDTATLQAPGQPERQINLPRRNLRDCIAEELRRLEADEIYADVLTKGLSGVQPAAGATPAPAVRPEAESAAASSAIPAAIPAAKSESESAHA